MANVIIIGAGQLGSRHLQALKSVEEKLNISVVDAFENSLKVSKERYDGINVENKFVHQVSYSTNIPVNNDFDVAIIATSSNARRSVIENLLNKNKVRFFILEKILFNKLADYDFISSLLKEKRSKAWVNCSMRKMSFYNSIKNDLGSNRKIIYQVTGSQYGLITNSIHYIDHMASLSACSDYSLDLTNLDKEIIKSKREGFLELNGIMSIKFTNGSVGIISCNSKGNMPIVVEIKADNLRCISRESEGKAWVSYADSNWLWQEVEARIPYQSQMTTELVTELLEKGTCPLVEYDDSSHIHKQLMEPLREYLNKIINKSYDFYPFT
jgi:hypothetical protein